jgi:hypothetical protein
MEEDFTPAEIEEMIAEEGQPVLIEITTDDEYVPGSGEVTGTVLTEMGFGVLLPFSRGLRAMENSGIDSRDQQLLLGSEAISRPSLNTYLAVDGKIFSFVEVNTLAPKGVDLYYDCTVRGAQ